LLGVVAAIVLTGWALRPRQYYRYGGGRVWLEDNPNACWNGLLRAPVFQFEAPPFKRARSWKPTPQQIREELRSSTNLDLSEQEITQIIRSCVSCEEQLKR